MEKCPVCNSEETNISHGKDNDLDSISCPLCGKYKMTWEAKIDLNHKRLSERQRANISGWLYDNQGHTIIESDIERLTNLKPPTFNERADKLLIAIEKETIDLGDFVCETYGLLTCTWCRSEDEFEEIISYLIKCHRLVRSQPPVGQSLSSLKITPEGWARLEEIRKINPESEQGFVAMWFNEEVNHVYDDCIALAISDAGYKPHRVDKREHNDKIDDEIVAQIRQSRFVVSDFTGHRGGVYFEAGFAKGLGLEVFWACRDDNKEDLHFDIRQYNCILWEEDELGEFRKNLTNRIVSVLGKGNYKV